MAAYRRHANRRVKDVANGQAGLATFMHVIEHEMLGKGCPHGKVLPLTAAHAETYTGFRRNIENEYCDVIAISTASGDGASMSADTGIQEMLLVGTKHKPPNGSKNGGQYGDRAVTCVNLHTTFENKLQAKMFADAIRRAVAAGPALRRYKCRWNRRHLLPDDRLGRGQTLVGAGHQRRLCGTD